MTFGSMRMFLFQAQTEDLGITKSELVCIINDQPRPSNLSPNTYASDIESTPNQTTELLNVSFISNDGNIVET